MYPYIILVAAPILCAVVLRECRVKPQIGNRISLGLFFTLLLALLALRAPTIGRDLSNYQIYFNEAVRFGWSSVKDSVPEPLFMALNVLVAAFTDNFQIFLAVVAVLTVVPIAISYLRNAKDAVLTILLFLNLSVFIILFSTLRQAMTMALGLIAYEFTKRKQWYFFLPIVVLAFFIHKSALALLLLYPLYHIRISRRWMIGIVPAYMLLFAFRRQIFSLCLRLIDDYYGRYTVIEDTGAYMMLLLLVLLSVFVFSIPDEARIDRETAALRNILLLTVMIQMFASLHPLAMRINYYYLVFVPILIPRLIVCRPQTNRAVRGKRILFLSRRKLALLAKYVMIVFFLVYFFISAPRQNLLDTFPYRFFWEV